MAIEKLNNLKAKNAKAGACHGDGGGLWLQVRRCRTQILAVSVHSGTARLARWVGPISGCDPGSRQGRPRAEISRHAP